MALNVREITLDNELQIAFASYVKGDKGDAFTYDDFTQEQLAALKGDDGDSAYDIAVQEGYVGTKEEWLASLHGEDGQDGVSGGLLFPTMEFDPNTGVLVIRGLEQEVDRIGFDEETAELIIRL